MNRNRVRAIAAVVLNNPDILPQQHPKNAGAKLTFETFVEFFARVAHAEHEALLRSRSKMGISAERGNAGDPLPFENVR